MILFILDIKIFILKNKVHPDQVTYKAVIDRVIT